MSRLRLTASLKPALQVSSGDVLVYDSLIDTNAGGGILMDSGKLRLNRVTVRSNGKVSTDGVSWSGMRIRGGTVTIAGVRILSNGGPGLVCDPAGSRLLQNAAVRERGHLSRECRLRAGSARLGYASPVGADTGGDCRTSSRCAGAAGTSTGRLACGFGRQSRLPTAIRLRTALPGPRHRGWRPRVHVQPLRMR